MSEHTHDKNEAASYLDFDSQDELPVEQEADEGRELAIELDEVVDAEVVDAPAGGSIVTLEPESLAKLATEDQIQAAIQRTLARIDATKRYKVALLSMTNYRDWVAHTSEGDPDGAPYLQESGSEKIVHAFNIEIEHDGGEKELHDDGTYEYVYNGQMRALTFSDVWYPITGSRWSGDGFFTKGGKQRPDPGDVRKSALTNFYNRGIKTVCGLRTLTWEELESIPHLKDLRKRVKTLGFESGGGNAEAPGVKSDIGSGPHICVKIKYGDETNKKKIKSLRPWNWNKAEKYWEIGYTVDNFKRVLDMHAADEQGVQFKVLNVDEKDLP